MIRFIPFASVLALASYPTEVSAISSAAKSAFDYATSKGGLIDVSDAPGTGVGKVVVAINENNNNLQTSNYDWRSGIVRNVGDKRIAAVYLDLSDSVIPDIIFDGDGTGGDDVSKPLSHDWGTTETNPVSTSQYQWEWQPVRSSKGYNAGATFDPDNLGNVNNLFVDELSDSGLGCGGGFRGGLILFKDFDAGEEYEFSSDTDPNSLAGLNQGTSNNHAAWDVGGVSGAEMIGSEVSILFGDGSTASGTISADGSLAGGVAVVSEELLAAPGLKVGNLNPGGSGNYAAKPKVVVSGKQGDKVRVTRLSAFSPGDNQKALADGAITAEALMTARLMAQAPHFPYTNAQGIQHVEVTIPASGSAEVNFKAGNSDLGAAYTAVVVGDDGLPLSLTSSPISTSTPVSKTAKGNLVANGSFESNESVAGSCKQYPEYMVEGWASVNADLEVCGTGFDGVEAYDGSAMLELDVNGGGAKDGIFQHLATEKGRLYKLSFFMMTTHNNVGHNHVSIEVSWRDQTIMNSYHAAASFKWSEIVVIFEGSGGDDPLVIKERLRSTGRRPLIDNVVVSPL